MDDDAATGGEGGGRRTKELSDDILVPVVEHVREEMHVMTVGQGTAQHVAGDDVDAAGEPTLLNRSHRNPVDGRLFQNRRAKRRKAGGHRAREDTGTARDIQQPVVHREVEVRRESLTGQQPTAIHRRGELLRERLGLHRAMPVTLFGSTREARWLIRPENLDQVSRDGPIAELRIVGPEEPWGT